MGLQNENQDLRQLKAAAAGKQPIVAAIGASAGGIEALRSFFAAVPTDLGVAFVVIIHLSPDHPSELASILAACTTMPVAQVTNTVVLAPNQIYVIPPDRELTVSEGTLHVTPFTEPRGQRTPIDAFFLSLAAAHGDGFGIVLSGNGTDGSVGIKAIKEHGGLVLVQDPAEAIFVGMPQSAIATGIADLILPVHALAARMVDLTRSKQRLQIDPAQLAAAEVATLAQIVDYLAEQCGHDFSGYQQATILRRIGRRVQLTRTADYATYLHYLQTTPSEVPVLFADLLIAVSTFFREPTTCAVLAAHVIPQLFAGKGPNDQVRVWVPGCATGEEAYTIAILLLEYAQTLSDPPLLQIFASDLDEQALTIARAGRYPDAITSDLSAERLLRFFVREGNYYVIKPAVRECLIFSPHNLLTDPPFARLDLIACRHVLPYLGHPRQQQLLYNFHYALWRKAATGGYLLLGANDASAHNNERFQPIDREQGIFQSRQEAGQRLPILSELLDRWQQPLLTAKLSKPITGLHSAMQHHRQALEAAAPPSILVDEELRAIHLSENAGHFLHLPGGTLTSDITRLVRPELQGSLAQALRHALSEGRSTYTPAIVVNFEGNARQVNLLTRPVQPNNGHKMQALVIFIDAGPALPWPNQVPVDEAGVAQKTKASPEERAAALQAELQQTRTELQASRAEYAASLEQLYSTNEELQTINEEYSSITEELQTSREELQSLNEELQTVNDELLLKLREISQAHSDLQNLMTAAEVGTLFLDRQLHIRRFTPPVTQIFQIKANDLGRPITDLAHQLIYNGLIDDARRVMQSGSMVEHEICNEDGTWYLLRLRPYRTVNNQIDGVVVTFVDITKHKTAEAALRQLNETLEQRVAERTGQVRALASRLTMAEQEERRRIAQILHDQLQQQLYGVQMRVMSMRLDIETQTYDLISDYAQEVYQWLSDAIRTTRHLTVDLSPPVLKDEGLVDALQWLATQMAEVNGLQVTLQADHAFPIANEDMRVLLFQIVRELLFNVIKHADVNQATVTLDEKQNGEIMIAVSDRGQGFNPASAEAAHNGGFGLFSVRERLGLFGGHMTIKSSPGQGTTVMLSAPAGA